MTSWPTHAGWAAFARALPFEHLLRGRPAAQAMQRWKDEAHAFDAASGCRVALLVEDTGSADHLALTVASWALQTWPDAPWLCVGRDGAKRVEALCGARGLPPPLAMVDTVSADLLARLAIDWVVPAVAGDVLHPSLAGVVALCGPASGSVVGWDWLDAEWTAQSALRPTCRRRAPACDGVAELRADVRGRAFAVPSSRWHGRPRVDAWRNRYLASNAASDAVHAEPLGIYPHIEGAAAPDPCDAASHWGRPFERAPDGTLQPSMPAASTSVLIMYRDRAELTARAVRSVVRQQLPGQLELVLLDNGSSPAARAEMDRLVAELGASVGVVRVDCPGPFNHSRQARVGAQAASGDVLVFLNNDASLDDASALDRLGRWALLPRVASVGLRLVDGDDRCVGGGFDARLEPGAEFNSPVEEAVGERGRVVRETVGNTFACAAVSADAFARLGGLDDVRFPAGYNDVDYCLRACAAGWRHLNLADVRARHDVGASRPRVDEIAQKLLLRQRYPWVPVRARTQLSSQAVDLPELSIPALPPTFAAPPETSA